MVVVQTLCDSELAADAGVGDGAGALGVTDDARTAGAGALTGNSAGAAATDSTGSIGITG